MGYLVKTQRLVECQCDCGNRKFIRMQNILKGMTTSCKCFSLEMHSQLMKSDRHPKSNKLPDGVARRNNLYALYKNSAKKRNLVWDLSIEEFEFLNKQDCVYCGCPPSQSYKSQNNTGDYIYNGIDRIDSSKGYLKENCQSCCGICNFAKRERTNEEFLDWVKKVYERSVNVVRS
jgi:hypothetical protein